MLKLEERKKTSRQSSDLFIQNLRKEIGSLKTKLERLSDAYLDEVFELAEFQEKKNKLMSEKKSLEEKLSDFERKGNHWLELTRNWILEANQAKNLVLREDFPEMKNLLKKIGSNPHLTAGRLSVVFKSPWQFLAELPVGAYSAPTKSTRSVQCSEMWCLLEKVGTFYEQNPQDFND